jgi:hypothetical protein
MKISLAVALLLGSYVSKDGVNAITEEPESITMRDGNASKQRPKNEAYDMDE